MHIKKIFIESFGKLERLTLDLSGGLNVIYGENEIGKSSISAFIKYMLYGFDNESVPGALDERNKRINWSSGTAEGMMNVRVKDKRYLISRTTARIESSGRVSYKEDASLLMQFASFPFESKEYFCFVKRLVLARSSVLRIFSAFFLEICEVEIKTLNFDARKDDYDEQKVEYMQGSHGPYTQMSTQEKERLC